jgi:HNH endonuclease
MTNLFVQFTSTEIKRFWTYVDKSHSNQCWDWLKSCDGNGYGKFRARGKLWKANRVAYYLCYQQDPGKLNVCHACDNPRCCNPNHLWLGTHGDNMRDAWEKGRRQNPKQTGELNPSAKLTWENVVEIRKLYARGGITQVYLGRKFGVTSAMVHLIVKDKAWLQEI